MVSNLAWSISPSLVEESSSVIEELEELHGQQVRSTIATNSIFSLRDLFPERRDTRKGKHTSVYCLLLQNLRSAIWITELVVKCQAMALHIPEPSELASKLLQKWHTGHTRKEVNHLSEVEQRTLCLSTFGGRYLQLYSASSPFDISSTTKANELLGAT